MSKHQSQASVPNPPTSNPTPPTNVEGFKAPFSPTHMQHQRIRSQYSAAAAEQILNQAMQDAAAANFSWETLLSMGTELGISPAALSAAEQRWREERQQQQQRRQRQRQRRQQVQLYLGVNILLVIINILICGQITWAIWPIIGWGASLVLPQCSKDKSPTQKTVSG
ncbi:MAG: 2TM domain-containing protein [Cyanobacteria bacterium J06632_3]